MLIQSFKRQFDSLADEDRAQCYADLTEAFNESNVGRTFILQELKKAEKSDPTALLTGVFKIMKEANGAFWKWLAEFAPTIVRWKEEQALGYIEHLIIQRVRGISVDMLRKKVSLYETTTIVRVRQAFTISVLTPEHIRLNETPNAQRISGFLNKAFEAINLALALNELRKKQGTKEILSSVGAVAAMLEQFKTVTAALTARKWMRVAGAGTEASVLAIITGVCDAVTGSMDAWDRASKGDYDSALVYGASAAGGAAAAVGASLVVFGAGTSWTGVGVVVLLAGAIVSLGAAIASVFGKRAVYGDPSGHARGRLQRWQDDDVQTRGQAGAVGDGEDPLMVLTPPPPSRALAAICYVAALGAGGLGVFLVAQVLPGDGSQQKRLFFMGLAGLSLSFALLMVAVAELGRRGVLLWRNEGGKLIGQVMATGEQVFMPARGPARVDVEQRALSNGVNAEQYSVWLFSPLFGPVRMGAGGGGNVEIVRQRWGAVTFSEADAEFLPRPPLDSGVEVEPDGRCRVPAGWGLFAMLFLMSGLLVVLPMVAVALMSSRPGGQLFAAGTCVVAATVALFTLLYAFSHWELRRPTLTGVLWLTAALRRTSGACPQSAPPPGSAAQSPTGSSAARSPRRRP